MGKAGTFQQLSFTDNPGERVARATEDLGEDQNLARKACPEDLVSEAGAYIMQKVGPTFDFRLTLQRHTHGFNLLYLF